MRISFPDLDPKHEGKNALTPEQLGAFLDAVRMECPQHYAMICFMAFTGLRHCHVSPLRWEDVDEKAMLIRVTKSNVHGVVGKVRRRKKAPTEYPLTRDILDLLRWHRERLLRYHKATWRGFESGLVFPSRVGKVRTGPSNLRKGWQAAMEASGLVDRLTPHGLRRTFVDLGRRGDIGSIVVRSMTGHTTEAMQQHYSSVGLDEQRAALKEIIKLVPRG
jgi:integrase